MAVADVNVIMLMLMISSSIGKPVYACYESIISFGDSLADNGNLPLLRSIDKQPSSTRPPYGETYFHHPTGRNSDGRLIIDFIAESLGLPLVQPYLGGENAGRSFSTGVNFAVAGAMALDHELLEKRGIHNPITNVTLGTQLDWFKQFLAKLPDGKKFLQSSLVLMGEIGGNEYNCVLINGTTEEVIKSLGQDIVSYIGSTIEELINLGVKTMLVPGNLPIGCLPFYLTRFKTSNEKYYNSKTGCLNWLNKISANYNELLKKELSRIRELHPDVNIIYADYYNAALRFYRFPDKFGFTKQILRACCGVGGIYNYNALAECGTLPATPCDDPSSVASWDGMHFTEAAYKVIAEGLLEGLYTTPRFRNVCPSILRRPGFSGI